ncbi:hypothetical protein LTS18_008497 [Coniosporium uncinatum]|uniref:Uncharacterized protein n=1 Tax=Coniosporium uncinatum TaxID=93489 RepID=A0ACC3D234_9PEZI|nr:hypothetical protein LTS18_008497 [Coniosporium uncinatum]
MSSIVFASTLLLLATPSTFAWGTLGHDTVALIAQNYLVKDAVTFCQDILNDTSDTYLASVATWADSYRYTADGKFSAPYHFIDANDSPPSSCNVDFNRDCGEQGCVVSAISNYTDRVRDPSLSSSEINNALRFIIHFVGDIHQPLHDEALEVGGNDIDVTFGGVDTNLHHIWYALTHAPPSQPTRLINGRDTNMPEKLIGGSAMSDAQTWSTDLISRINNGTYTPHKRSWISNLNVSDAITTSMGWARDANSHVCSTVLPEGQSAVEGMELDGEYYDSAIAVIEEQIAKAGYRLAGWLNTIATGDVGLEADGKVVMREPNSYRKGRVARPWSAARFARMAGGHRC